MSTWIRLGRVGGLCVLGLLAVQVSAESGNPQAQDSDWPCEQILVPQVAAAVIWDGPPVEGIAWRGDPRVADLVSRIAPSSVPLATAESAIADFAKTLSPEKKSGVLTKVFAGLLDTLNRDRATLIDGIRRYARDQAARAENLGGELDRMVQLEKESSPAVEAERAALKARLTMEERVFDERERAFPYLCSRPVAVEQRLGALARAISTQMD